MPKKQHDWKICQAGSYFVKAHYKVINSKKHHWSAHCRKGKSTKSVLNLDEIHEISKNFNKTKLKMPTEYKFRSSIGNKYDLLIAGWSKYWQDVFKVQSKISPTFIKTLMMSESGFRKDVTATTHNRPGQAMGLMQITDYTFKLIQESEKELRNHAFRIKRKDLFDPNVNICVGVRWLYRKREIAKYFLKKEPSEFEIAQEYKGIRKDKSQKANGQRKNFKNLVKELKSAK